MRLTYLRDTLLCVELRQYLVCNSQLCAVCGNKAVNKVNFDVRWTLPWVGEHLPPNLRQIDDQSHLIGNQSIDPIDLEIQLLTCLI